MTEVTISHRLFISAAKLIATTTVRTLMPQKLKRLSSAGLNAWISTLNLANFLESISRGGTPVIGMGYGPLPRPTPISTLKTLASPQPLLT